MEITRPTVMEVDLKAFKHNIKQIKSIVGNNVGVMPVIKANGYGTHINMVLDVINEFDIVAVATVDEAVVIRNLGYKNQIFVLNQAYKDEIEKIINYDITVGISSDSFIENIGKTGKKVKVHIEIGTGMGRTGINPDRTKEYIDRIKKYENIEVEGIYTHLSSADCDENYTKEQLDLFEKALKIAKENLSSIKYVHTSASNGVLNFKNSYYNLVRPGLMIYGYEPFENAFKNLDLKPVCKLKSKITLLKEVDEGTSISYSRSFITKRKTKVATIPIGYADGLRRGLSNKGEVVINGKKVPIIGKVCMDGFMADVTDLENVSVGDDVYIWDNNIITLDEVAKKLDTINYEIMCTISDRVPRIFVK